MRLCRIELRKERIAKIGILRTGHVSKCMMRDHSEFSDMFARILDGHGFDFTVRVMIDNEVSASTINSDGSTGSRHPAYDEFKRIDHLLDYFLTSTLFSGKHLFLSDCVCFLDATFRCFFVLVGPARSNRAFETAGVSKSGSCAPCRVSFSRAARSAVPTRWCA